MPDTCDGGKNSNCREVFLAWYDRCWAAKDVQTMLGLIPGAREQLTDFYGTCGGVNPGGGGSGGGSAAGTGQCADLDSRVSAMNGECCDEPSEDCSSGQPSACNAGCASVLLPFFTDCSEVLGKHANAYRPVVDMCQQALLPPPRRPRRHCRRPRPRRHPRLSPAALRGPTR